MKVLSQNMKCFPKFLRSTVGVFFSSTFFLQAQIPGTIPSPVNAAVLKLFGQNTNFTAKADVRVLDNSEKETMTMTVGVALLDGKMRVEMDLARMKSPRISQQTSGQIRQMGADKTIYMVDPKNRMGYVIYPALNAYAKFPLSQSVKRILDLKQLRETPLGKETIDSHICIKNKVSEMEEGQIREAVVWNATDLKDFPIQIQMKQKDSVVVLKFKEVQFGKPDPKQFELPSGYSKYQSMPELQRVMVEKLMGTRRN